MIIFLIIVSIVVLQRIAEVIYARVNEKRMKRSGAVEIGRSHYKWIVLLHVSFFVSLIAEVMCKGVNMGSVWPLLFFIFLASQALRIWTLASLGKYWNTKIIVLPGEKRVKRGPYRFLSHPNYLIVAVELLIIPLLFGAWVTAVVFSLLNALLLLFIRIPAEEEALRQLRNAEKEKSPRMSVEK
ncbi:isoprenylcysteine carboxyl methyltransferase family protein [Bacillus piscicola]|uniref:isoprenylcysteine carboxyl methyltransferase family protein n=1 Tax=Bacillus piscicola TaxID=1632684 RepID=UPI001F09A144|nr:isoprenylcysteine carboxylmethyltransferase family protein [Bacillus piscicola]